MGIILKYFFIIVVFVQTINSQTFDLAENVDLKTRIDGILSKVPPSTAYGVLILDPMTNKILYQANSNEPLIPASNTKLFTTSVALCMMGGNYELSTLLLCDKDGIKGEDCNGNIYLKGYGNSLFTEVELSNFADLLYNKGVRRINGNVIGDDTYFDDVYTRKDWITDETQNAPLPPISALVLDKNTRVFTGTKKVGRGRRAHMVTYSRYESIKNPPVEIAEIFKEILQRKGISVSGTCYRAAAPKEAERLAAASVKLKDLIAIINKRSDNFLAECLFKTIGAVSSAIEGNAFYSTQAIKTFLKDYNIYCEGTYLNDGSGLSKNNRTSVASIAGLLYKMYFDIMNFDDFNNSLSIAGEDGTLGRRMRNDGFKFRGKTGTLNGSSALSGYLTTDSGKELIISIIFEFKQRAEESYKMLENEIVEAAAEVK